jgi:Ca-activated chloride channel family protein
MIRRPTNAGHLSRALFISAALVVAITAAAQPKRNCTEDAILVFDASGSMARLADGGETRISLAQQAARRVVPDVASVRQLGLMVYGPGKGSVCENISLRVAPAPDNASAILAEIDNLVTRGETPLTRAVADAAAQLDYRNKPAVIVLLTDGDENCNGDPCATGRALKEGAYDLTIHVVSFRVGTTPRFRAACLAEETGGLFVPTNTLDELVEALTRALQCPEIAGAKPRVLASSLRKGGTHHADQGGD